MKELRARIFDQLHGTGTHGLTVTQRLIFFIIVLGVCLAVVGTEPELPPGVQEVIDEAEFAIGLLFVIEYVARIWSASVDPRYAGLVGRFHYARQPVLILDLLALSPFLLGLLGAESLLLRLVRVLRLLALSKVLRYSEAMRIVLASVSERRYELLFAVTLAGLMILISSAALYVVEGSHQPEAFGSILRAMWWSVVTLTTVGYGDVIPQTLLGKFFAALTAFAGIGMIAMPTGILAASFSDGFARARTRRSQREQREQRAAD